MEQLLNQLGGLALGSVPTIVLFLLLLAAYGVLVRRPLDGVLAERRLRTTGAVEQARGAISAAEAETQVFEDKLRSAKAELFAAREERVKQWTAERERVLQEAKTETSAKVMAARLKLEQSASAARSQIESMSGELSAQVLRAVLPQGAAEAGSAQ